MWLILSVLFMGGIQLIAIIGEYLSRISTNVRNRPLQVIRESNVEEEQISKSPQASCIPPPLLILH